MVAYGFKLWLNRCGFCDAYEIDVETRDSAGFNYVIDMLSSWRNRAKYHDEFPRAAGLIDLDPEAIEAANSWNKVDRNIKSAKCFKLTKPAHIIPVLRAGFKVPVVLEVLYDRDAWLWADEHGHLQDRHLPNIVPSELSAQIIAGNTTLDEHLDEDWTIFVKKEFTQAGKGPMSRHFSRMEDDIFRQRLACLERLVNDITQYLFE